MRIMILSQMFPDSKNENFGVFIQREVESMSQHCEQIVISPRPWLPGNDHFKDKDRRNFSHNDKTEVIYPKYFPLPGKLFLWIKGVWITIFILYRIYKVREYFDFDLIHAHKLFPEGFVAIMLKILFKTPVIISLRGADITELMTRRLILPQLKYVLNRADLVFSVSKSLRTRALSVDKGCKDKIVIMPKGVDAASFYPDDQGAARETLSLPKNKFIILTVGWLIERKNPLSLVNAAKKMSTEDRETMLFVMIGEGHLKRKIIKQINENELDDNFLLAGRVPNNRVATWMNAADCFVLPSFSEGMPNVVYEAMACGLPIIASKVDGAAEIITENVSGLFITPEDHDLLAAHLKKLAGDKCLCKRLGDGALQYMEKNSLSWKNNSLFVLKYYKEICQ